MTIHRSLVLILALTAGIIGAFIARSVRSKDPPTLQLIAKPSPAPAGTTTAVDDCSAERTELASTKLQLAICMAITMPATKRTPRAVAEASTSDPSESPEIRRNRELLESDSEAVIVRRKDGTIGIYKPGEWSPGGDGVIIGRKFPDGEFGWYSRPVEGAGTEGRLMFRGTSIEIEPDGRITAHGKPAPPSVMRMLGGTVDEPSKP